MLTKNPGSKTLFLLSLPIIALAQLATPIYHFGAIKFQQFFMLLELFSHENLKKTISQIDLPPTLLGIMNFSYNSKFIGNDVLTNEKHIKERAFMGTYQIVGQYVNNQLFTLSPKKQIKIFDVKVKGFGWNGSEEIETKNYDQKNLDETIDYYRVADYLFTNGLIKNDKRTAK
jgi:hypothetical protein